MYVRPILISLVQYRMMSDMISGINGRLIRLTCLKKTDQSEL